MSSRGRWLPIAAVVIVLVLIAFFTRARGQGAPLDPNGTGSEGAKAFVLLLRQYGADVELVDGVPDAGESSAVVLGDRLDDTRRQALMTWVEAGHRLVVADPTSELQPGSSGPDVVGTVVGPCPALGVRDVYRLDVGPSLTIDPAPGAAMCFDRFVVTARRGRGRVIGLGGAGVWLNSRLDHAGNAALAVALLAGGPAPRVAFLLPSEVGQGRRSVSTLIGARPKLAAAQLVVAFVLLALWRGRRFGRPVTERQPVRIAGSEIVVAVGDLMHRSGDRDVAARTLREATRSRLAARHGLAPTATAAQIGAAVGFDAGVLLDAPVRTDHDLVVLAQNLSRLSAVEAVGAAH